MPVIDDGDCWQDGVLPIEERDIGARNPLFLGVSRQFPYQDHVACAKDSPR